MQKLLLLLFFLPYIADASNNFNELAKRCAPNVDATTMQALARSESGFNPYAIGVVHGALAHQPHSLAEALAAVSRLNAQGKNFSMGLVQVNKYNLTKFGLTYESVFDPCHNLQAGAKILTDCFTRASAGAAPQVALQKAFSCYYSGNFSFGFTQDFKGQASYVQKVVSNAKLNSATITVPAIDVNTPIIAGGKQNTALSGKKSRSLHKASMNNSSIKNTSNTHNGASWDVFAEF